MQSDIHFIRFNMEILYLKRFIEKSLFPLLSGSHVILQHINSSQACSISRANLFNIITRLSEVHPTVCTGIIETRLLSQKKKKKLRSQNRDGELVLGGQRKDCGDHNRTPRRSGGLDARGRTQHWCTPESEQRSPRPLLFSFVTSLKWSGTFGISEQFFQVCSQSQWVYGGWGFSPLKLTQDRLKKMHHLKVENNVSFGGQNWRLTPGTQLLSWLAGLLWRGQGGIGIYGSLCNKDQAVGTSEDCY